MQDDIKLPELPEARIVSYQTDSTMRTMKLRTYDGGDMQAYARAAVLADRDGRQQWISVNDRLPENDELVLVLTPAGRYQKVSLDCWRMQREAPLGWSSATIETGMGWDDHEYEEVTHWMPLPAPPAQAQRAKEDVDASGT